MLFLPHQKYLHCLYWLWQVQLKRAKTMDTTLTRWFSLHRHILALLLPVSFSSSTHFKDGRMQHLFVSKALAVLLPVLRIFKCWLALGSWWDSNLSYPERRIHCGCFGRWDIIYPCECDVSYRLTIHRGALSVHGKGWFNLRSSG